MESELVSAGYAILAEQQARTARAEAEVQAIAELRIAAPAILDLLTAMAARIAGLEQQVVMSHEKMDHCTAMVMATRIRRPIRDASGTIRYVVDELAPPPDVAALIEE
jgi:multidrug resistance efflux pump